jgi:hypothetical protein
MDSAILLILVYGIFTFYTLLSVHEFKKRGYLYATIAFFAVSWLIHGITAFNQFVEEQNQHGQQIEMNVFWNEFIRQTTENWQSEFLQLSWQIGGLMILFAVASPQDRPSDQRKEKILEKLLEIEMDKKEYDQFMKSLEKKYPEK